MAAQLGGSQISSLLESLPGIANVLRSPVADALVRMIRAGAGLGEFHQDDVQELVQYAVRRGLLGSEEGEELLAEVKGAGKKTRGTGRTKKKAGKKTGASSKSKTGTKKATAARGAKAVKRATGKKKASATKRKPAKRVKKKR
jgi:polyhydroxyalkanoate synthesis regulator phasin